MLSSAPNLAVPQHREQLLYLLTEAAELEHGLMCSYLYACFSLRRGGGDIDRGEAAAVERWRRSIREVAVEEMLHLAIVQNLLTSIGGAPHLQRPNFPVSPGLYPSGIVLQLRRLDEATLDHFVFLERPDGVDIPDGDGFAPVDDYERGTPRAVTLMPSAQDYSSVAALYRGIEDGFDHLAHVLGEKRLFIGEPEVQVGSDLLALDGLHPVRCLQSAKAAISRIIEQGEGGRRAHQTSHYDRFCRIQNEYKALQRARPDFEPAYPVASNPVMHQPVDPESRAYVTASDAARVLDIGNSAYGLMVQLLARFFGAGDEYEARRVLVSTAISLMSHAIAPIAELLTTIPIQAGSDETAGLSFTLPRSIHALPQRAAAWTLLHERTLQLAAACRSGTSFGVLETVAGHLERIARELRCGRDQLHSEPSRA